VSENIKQEKDAGASTTNALVRRHLRIGWWGLLLFLAFGIALEAMHGFKFGLYLDVSNEMRRLMWTLAHAHGTLFSLAQIAFAATLHILRDQRSWQLTASRFLIAGTILVPGGFFLGGVYLYGGDPGMGVFLVPLGALFFFIGVFLTAKGTK
tara:strand:+ start:5685 stop:6140 length:456 start_codon:yes stop_codon:yes gene_type:complete